MRKKPLRKWTMVEVHWADIYSLFGNLNTETLDDYAECTRRSVGYVQVDAPDRLVIVHTDDRFNTLSTDVGDALVIPRGVVRKVTRLGPVRGAA